MSHKGVAWVKECISEKISKVITITDTMGGMITGMTRMVEAIIVTAALAQ